MFIYTWPDSGDKQVANTRIKDPTTTDFCHYEIQSIKLYASSICNYRWYGVDTRLLPPTSRVVISCVFGIDSLSYLGTGILLEGDVLLSIIGFITIKRYQFEFVQNMRTVDI